MQPVLILGGGINGCALARELLLNRVPVTLVEQSDLAFGATSYSSRLIHGGLRYLEYGEFSLVKESLAERTRLLRLAPQFVRPLELFIPSSNRCGGVLGAAARFAHWPWWPATAKGKERGAWLVDAGLSFYDIYARDPTLPKHRSASLTAADALPVNRDRYRFLSSYYDAQVSYPERFSLALLEDARRLAEEHQLELRVLTYHEARLSGAIAQVHPTGQPEQVVDSFLPSAIINATGAWVDMTLQRLPVASQQLMGGTKGSHLFTFHEPLRQALAGRGIYAEAADGRPIFITPLVGTTLIGTTDMPYQGNPADAVATDDEVSYLIDSVNTILPTIKLSRADIAFHYSGVRPLPKTDASRPAAITRRHWIERNASSPAPLFNIIGGKLTTCRSLAEESVDKILTELKIPVRGNSRERALPGGEHYPQDAAALAASQQSLARRFGLAVEQVQAVWELLGTRAAAALDAEMPSASQVVPDTNLPVAAVRWIIRHEWVRTLDDLVERRLMLLYHQQLTRAALRTLAELLVAEQLLAAGEVEAAVAGTVQRLRSHFDKHVS